MSVSMISTGMQVQPVSVFARVLWALDYIPILSTGKGIIDIFVKNYWNPKNFHELSFYAKSYYSHLTDKEDIRYIALIPVLGNVSVLGLDGYYYAEQQYQLLLSRRAELGDTQAIEKLYEGSPEQRAKALECYYKLALSSNSTESRDARRCLLKVVCGKEGEEKRQVLAWFLQNIGSFKSAEHERMFKEEKLPEELRVKIIDQYIHAVLSKDDFAPRYLLSKQLKTMNVEDEKRATDAIKRSAEGGNAHALRFIQEQLLYDSAFADALFAWVVQQAETLSSPMNQRAWDLLNSKYYSRKQTVLSSYFNMLQIPNLPRERLDYILNKLSILQLIGTPEEKAKVFAGFLRVAEGGNAKFMHKVAKSYLADGNEAQAMTWLDRAAKSNHLSSILKLAQLLVKRNDLKGAEFWLTKATGRCHSSSKQWEYQQIVMMINLKKRGAADSRAREDFNYRYQEWFSGFNRTYTQAKDRAHQTHEQESRRSEQTRAQEQKRDTASYRAEIAKVIGDFSNARELTNNWRKWCLKGGHPDKGGSEEEFKRVTNLKEMIEKKEGWV